MGHFIPFLDALKHQYALLMHGTLTKIQLFNSKFINPNLKKERKNELMVKVKNEVERKSFSTVG